MSNGLSDLIRSKAASNYVGPALRAGRTQFSIRVRELQDDLMAGGFPAGHTPQICNALRTAKFLRENGLEIEGVDGPPSKQSPTVVVHYRLLRPEAPSSRADTPPELLAETAEARARRLAEGLRGLLKEEMAEFGGAEGFLRWVRGYDEEDAA
jgi:hypothetical protein